VEKKMCSEASKTDPWCAADDKAEVEQFLFKEARLLDDREFERWAELFLDDGVYWVPAKPGQKSHKDHVSIFYDDKEALRLRIRRLRHSRIHVQTPHSVTSHFVSNVVLESSEGPDEIEVCANVIMVEDRLHTDQRLFAGRATYRLRRVDGNLRIVLKRVDLTNSTSSFLAMALPI
jgi:3-phenylpropionate/cinnamic acid dioxygenase small subunit